MCWNIRTPPENRIFNRKYIFKRWIFHYHISFRKGIAWLIGFSFYVLPVTCPLGPLQLQWKNHLTTSLEINSCHVGARVSQDRKRDHVTYGTNNHPQEVIQNIELALLSKQMHDMQAQNSNQTDFTQKHHIQNQAEDLSCPSVIRSNKPGSTKQECDIDPNERWESPWQPTEVAIHCWINVGYLEAYAFFGWWHQGC